MCERPLTVSATRLPLSLLLASAIGLSNYIYTQTTLNSKKRGQRGIEPRTSSTLRRNHATRPLSRMLLVGAVRMGL